MQGQGQALGQRRPLGFPPQSSGPGQGQGQGAFGPRPGPPPPPLGQQMVSTCVNKMGKLIQPASTVTYVLSEI